MLVELIVIKLANNELIGYKPCQFKCYILPLDAVNLYGYIPCLPLPLCNFCWLASEEMENFNFLNIGADSEVGYILEVNLEYPDSCMDIHDDLPLYLQHLTLNYDDLSPYAKKLCVRLNLSSVYKCRKLIPKFLAKHNYIAHYLNLQFYIEQGLILRRIHKIMSFT